MKKTLLYTARGLFSNGVGRKGAFRPLPPLNRMRKRNTPANREKCRGVLWVGLQTMAIRPRFQPDSNLFPGKPGSCKTLG